MFKIISKAVIAASIVLAGCGSLPEKSKVDPNTGILAIAKAYKSEVSFDGGWAPQISLREIGKSESERTVKLPPVNGQQFQIIKNLAPGSYFIDKFRYVPTDLTTAIGNASPWEKIVIPFTIKAGEVTVLDRVLLAKTVTVGGDGNSASTSWDLAEWTTESKSIYVKLMEKYNKKGNWKVVDAKGQPFTN